MFDVAIIGGGVIGAATAYALSRYHLRVILLEKENDIATGATRANSAIIHAGYDPKPGTLMAKLNVQGTAMAPQLCRALDVPFKTIGSLVLAFSPEDMENIKNLYNRGLANQVPGLELWTAEQVKSQEPTVSDAVLGALYAPTAGIISPWEYALAMAETAVRNGMQLQFNSIVTGIKRCQGEEGVYYHINTSSGGYNATYVVNAAGIDSAVIHDMVAPSDFTIKPSRGEYYLMDKSEGKMANHVLFQCPTKLGKGVLVSPTVGGNLIVGPSAISSPKNHRVNTTAQGLQGVREAAARSVPGIQYRNTIRTFAGLRANTDHDDFIIREAAPHFIDLAGICSPGLSAAPAIGLYCVDLLKKSGLTLTENPAAISTRKRNRFNQLSAKKKAALIKENPLYGRVICRCETVTEGEIVDAIHSPIPPRSVDGVKRRVGAGMGRCQGGFCSPRVVEILSRELRIDPLKILKDTTGSYILDRETKEGAADK